MSAAAKKVAVVLLNLGGPDGPSAVEGFLFNLFNDKAIIGLPWPFRWLLAKVISKRRAPIAREIYQNLGGGSPLLPNTQAQAEALQDKLNRPGNGENLQAQEFKVFIAMRYWHPFAEETVEDVQAFDPDHVVLLPLYPQYSTTTTASSLANWKKMALRTGLKVPTWAICCYPTEEGFVSSIAELIAPRLKEAAQAGIPRLLFSAHGLPKKVIERGDPYQEQVEQTSLAVTDLLAQEDLDYVVCYQSRVGPLEWIGPSTEEEIERAGRDGRPLVVCPIAFVSEHSETLVELDIEYGELARSSGVPLYLRVPTVDTAEPFINGLACLVRDSMKTDSWVYF
ncbi:MAG: ferrochelatase [Pseudomonadota bacterium]